LTGIDPTTRELLDLTVERPQLTPSGRRIVVDVLMRRRRQTGGPR
jgi:hypothetical protein